MRTLLAAVLALGACYSPDLPDCVVACQAADECGEGQTCIDGVCRTQGATCEGSGSTTPPVAKVELEVTIEREGAVVVDGVGTCQSEESRHTCSWMVRAGSEVVLEARELDDHDFDKWTTANCAGQDATCSLVPTEATTVVAKFR